MNGASLMRPSNSKGDRNPKMYLQTDKKPANKMPTNGKKVSMNPSSK